MKKTKMTVFVAAILCVVAACACLMTGCGDKKVDYSTYTYEDFAKITQAEWDAKTISHQFYAVEGHSTNGMGSWYTLVNLYSDGSLLYLQGFDTGERPNGWNWADDEHNIRWANFGYWAVSDGTLKTNDGDTVDKDNILITHMRYWEKSYEEGDADILLKDDCTLQTEVWLEDGKYTIPVNGLYQWFTSNTNGASAIAVEMKDDVKYSNIKAWFDAWKDNIKEAGGPPMGGGDGQPPASDADRE